MDILIASGNEDEIVQLLQKHFKKVNVLRNDRYSCHVELEEKYGDEGIKVTDNLAKHWNYYATRAVRELKNLGYEASDQGLRITTKNGTLSMFHLFIVR